MLLPTKFFSILLFTCYQLFVSCQFDLDTNSIGTNTSLTYLFINSDSSVQLLPNILTFSDLNANSITARVSTESSLSNPPCFTDSNTPSCQSGSIESLDLSSEAATLFLKSVYYENPNPVHDRTVVVTVSISYHTRGSLPITNVSFANVLEKRDFPILSFRYEAPYAPVYNHEQRPVPFLDGSKFSLSSRGGLFTYLFVCVYTQTGLESLSVDTNLPNTNSPVTSISQDRVCSDLSFNSIDNTTLLQTFSAFSYSEKTANVSNYNDRVVSVSVDSYTNTGDPLYFNITYRVPPTPISIHTSPVVYYENVATQAAAPDISSVRMSDVINVTRQLPEDGKLITSLLLRSNSSHIPMVNLWNDQLCSTNRYSHPVHKFQFCSDEQFFFDLELTANFVQKFGLTKDTIVIEGLELNIFNATKEESYGFLTLIGSTTQTPDANHFSIWFKNAPGELMGCPLEIINGPFVDYQICLTGSESLIQFGYSGLAPEHHEVTVSYPTDGAFRLDDWNFVSVSVRRDSIDFLLNEVVLEPSEFYWFDEDENDNSTQIPVHLYSSSYPSAITNIYILGKDRGFIGELTGVVVDQFYIPAGEAHCMFSCIEGFYLNEAIIATLQQQGLEVEFVRQSIEVTGNMSLADVSFILQNVLYNTPMNSSRAYRHISVTASDDTFSATELTRISHQCTEGSCFNNTYCYTTDNSAECLCKEGYLDASTNGNMSLCKHPMDCSYLNGGCSALEKCVRTSEEVRYCKDECASAPCLNNGTCTAITLTQYNCICVGEFYGAECMCRNSCLSQDCSPGECIDFCDGSFICTTSESSSLLPTPSPTILPASSTSYVSSSGFAAVQSTYSPLYTAITTFISSSLSSQIPYSSPAVTETVSSLLIASQTATTGSSVVDASPSSVRISASSAIPSSSLQTDTLIQESTQLISASSVPQSSTPVIAMATSSVQLIQSSSLLASQYSQVASYVSSSQLTTSDSIVQPISSTAGVLLQTSNLLPSASTDDFLFPDISDTSQVVQSSSVVITSSLEIPSSSVVEVFTSSLEIPSSSRVEVITSSSVIPSSSLVEVITSSQVIPSSSVVEVITSSLEIPSSSVVEVSTSSLEIPSSSRVEVITSSSVIPSSSLVEVITSSQVIPSSSVVEVITSSLEIPSSSVVEVSTSSLEIPSSSRVEVITSSQVIPSSSVVEVITSSQVIPSSSVVEVITSSQVIPSSSVVEVITSSQVIPSSSVVEVITSSQVIPSSSVVEVITSSQVIPSSSVVEVITSSQVIPSSSVVEVITSSQVIPSSSVVEAITSSQVIPSSSVVEVITSSQVIPSSSVVEVITSSQVIPSSSVVEVITSSQVIPSSSVVEVITSSQVIPSSSVVEVITSSQVIPSSSVVEVITSSQVIPSSSVVEVITSSQVIPSSSVVEVITSSQVIPSSSVVEVITSSQVIPSSSVVEAITSSSPSSSVEEVITSSQYSSVASSVSVIQTPSAGDVTASPPDPDSSVPSLFADATSSSMPQSVVSSVLSSGELVASSAATPSSSLIAESSIAPSSTSVTQSTAQPEPRSNAAIGIGVALGIFLLILVIIAAITLVIALFLFRMNRFQYLDPTKSFDKPDSTSPAQITAVYKNEDSLLLN